MNGHDLVSETTNTKGTAAFQARLTTPNNLSMVYRAVLYFRLSLKRTHDLRRTLYIKRSKKTRKIGISGLNDEQS